MKINHLRPLNQQNKKGGHKQPAPSLHLTKFTLGKTAGRGQSPFELRLENATLPDRFISLLMVPKLRITPIDL